MVLMLLELRDRFLSSGQLMEDITSMDSILLKPRLISLRFMKVISLM